jgi:hypothetical protein
MNCPALSQTQIPQTLPKGSITRRIALNEREKAEDMIHAHAMYKRKGRRHEENECCMTNNVIYLTLFSAGITYVRAWDA